MPPENQNPNYSHLVQYVSALVVILAVAGVIYYFNFKNSVNVSPVYSMSGNISSVSGNSVVIHGSVGGKEKDVTFAVTSETIFKNSANVISMDQITSGQHFKPTLERRVGMISDLVKNLPVTKIISKEDLLQTSGATAVEIDYATFIPPAQ